MTRKAKFGDIFYDINLEVDQFLPHAKDASEINGSTSSNKRILQPKPKVNKASPPLGLLLKASNGVTNASNSMVAQPNTDVKMYSDRSTDSVSNRTLLADALESTTQHDVERKKLQEYKSKMPNKDVAEIQSLIKHEAKTSDNYLGIDVKWLYNTEKGHEYFALYSTANEKDPTILYACKNSRANYEHDVILDFIEEGAGTDESSNRGSSTVNEIFERNRNVPAGKNAGGNGSVGTGSNGRNAPIHRRNKRRQPSEAFQACLRNITENQKKASIDERYQFAVDIEDYATAQRMVDEAAEAAGYSIKGYHGRVN